MTHTVDSENITSHSIMPRTTARKRAASPAPSSPSKKARLNAMLVQELRDECATLGLSSLGTKPVLIQRLHHQNLDEPGGLLADRPSRTPRSNKPAARFPSPAKQASIPRGPNPARPSFREPIQRADLVHEADDEETPLSDWFQANKGYLIQLAKIIMMCIAGAVMIYAAVMILRGTIIVGRVLVEAILELLKRIVTLLISALVLALLIIFAWAMCVWEKRGHKSGWACFQADVEWWLCTFAQWMPGAAEKRTAEKRLAEKRAAEKRAGISNIYAAEKRAAANRAAEKRAAEKRAAEKQAAANGAADNRAAEKRAAEKRAAEKRAREAEQVQQSTRAQEKHATDRQIDRDTRPPSGGFGSGDKVSLVWNPNELNGVAVRWPATVKGFTRCLKGVVDSGGNSATLQYAGGARESVPVRGGEIAVKLQNSTTILTQTYGNLSAGDKIVCQVRSGFEKTQDGRTLLRQYQLQLDGFSHGGRMLADDDTLRKRHRNDSAPSRISKPSTGVCYGGGGNSEVTFINGSSRPQLVKAGGTGVFLGPNCRHTASLTFRGRLKYALGEGDWFGKDFCFGPQGDYYESGSDSNFTSGTTCYSTKFPVAGGTGTTVHKIDYNQW